MRGLYALFLPRVIRIYFFVAELKRTLRGYLRSFIIAKWVCHYSIQYFKPYKHKAKKRRKTKAQNTADKWTFFFSKKTRRKKNDKESDQEVIRLLSHSLILFAVCWPADRISFSQESNPSKKWSSSGLWWLEAAAGFVLPEGSALKFGGGLAAKSITSGNLSTNVLCSTSLKLLSSIISNKTLPDSYHAPPEWTDRFFRLTFLVEAARAYRICWLKPLGIWIVRYFWELWVLFVGSSDCSRSWSSSCWLKILANQKGNSTCVCGRRSLSLVPSR